MANKKSSSSKNSMSFLDHLEELRLRRDVGAAELNFL